MKCQPWFSPSFIVMFESVIYTRSNFRATFSLSYSNEIHENLNQQRNSYETTWKGYDGMIGRAAAIWLGWWFSHWWMEFVHGFHRCVLDQIGRSCCIWKLKASCFTGGIWCSCCHRCWNNRLYDGTSENRGATNQIEISRDSLCNLLKNNRSLWWIQGDQSQLAKTIKLSHCNIWNH